MGSDRMLPRYAYHNPFTVYFANKCEWQNGFNPDNKGSLVWYTDGYKTNKVTGAGVYRWGLRTWHSFRLRLHTAVFWAQLYALKACVMENIEEGKQIGTSISFLTIRQASRPFTAARYIPN
jgi:hypothetical protein